MKKRKAVAEFSPEILNRALTMSLEFGKNWLESIEGRVLQEFPDLSAEDASALESLCREIQKFSWKLCATGLSKDYFSANVGEEEGSSVESRNGEGVSQQTSAISEKIRVQYPFLSDTNLSKLISQGIYYARK